MRTEKMSVYLQIVEDVKRKILLGFLKQGDKLPSCRDMALQLGVNPNTVQRAYTILEEEGFIFSLPKKGVYIADVTQSDDPKRFIVDKIREIKDAGAQLCDVLRAVSDVYGEEI